MKKGGWQALRDLRLADLELFVTAARFKNLSQAAALCFLSQSAASTAIKRVETAFQKELCLHEKRQFRLTPDGVALLPRAEEWLRIMSENVLQSTPLALRIATTHAISRIALPSLVSKEHIEIKIMRPDMAYGALLRDEADVALVLDNAKWDGVFAHEIAKGSFQLFAKKKKMAQKPVIIPEDQLEVLSLMQKWQQMYKEDLPILLRVPSWSLIADLCLASTEVGFLPDFLGKTLGLHPVAWQPSPSRYRLLALYRKSNDEYNKRVHALFKTLENSFR